jgi:F-type H+-transporting ATPase subunit delta
MAKLISKTYGDALFEVAIEKNMTDVLFEEVEGVREVFKNNPKLGKFLEHPDIELSEKQNVVETVFSGRVSAEIVGFMHTIVDKGRAFYMDDIFAYFIGRVKEYKKIGIATVTSATELSKEQKKQIVNKLLSTTGYVEFEMNYVVDASLIGGIVIRIGDRVVDGSIKNKLEDMRKNLSSIQLA